MNALEQLDAASGLEIAIVGMTGRFPGAPDLETFWQNLRNGVEGISSFSDEALLAAGVDPATLRDPHYVRAGGVLADVELFDAGFFGFYPKEAEAMDPQQRVFLECAWEALEHAGYDPDRYKGLIGVFAGMGFNTYLMLNLLSNRAATASVSDYQLILGNDKDFLPTRVSYKLNLRGPSINVQTACSTSLVAVHLACQSLLSYQCDMALAGGVTIRLPQQQGYLYQEGGIASPDGHCRAFDARAQGTVPGNGVGVVALKRLADALEDGDTIYAVIKGSALNNDGALKVGYTAPSVDGQAEVIAMAQEVAGVAPETVSYIEAHGTGTPLGDPIEIAALTQVFRATTDRKGFCAIGSLKTNVGHLDAAAGVASLIKTTLALHHGELPPSLHFERPNPVLNLDNSPFYVNAKLAPWPGASTPRRAGVSSFGIGGTNAHVVLEAAPPLPPSGPAREWQVLLLAARTATALETATAHLAAHLQRRPDLDLADVAYTTQVGRYAFDHRRALVVRDRDEALALLEGREVGRVFSGQATGNRPVAFLFSGQGAQYVQMAAGLYAAEPLFRDTVDTCAALLRPHLDRDIREALFPTEAQAEEAGRLLNQTRWTQPALFVVEYALAKLWMAWGVEPRAMLGHSIGEYVAACLAGVFALEEALALVAARGRLMQELPGGAMLSVSLGEEDVRPLLGAHLDLAAVNAPDLCVVSGPAAVVAALEQRLNERGVACRRLHTSHAFHSAMMDPAVDAFATLVAQTPLNPPERPFVSNVTGAWITPEEATDPAYWARHLRAAVRFGDGLHTLMQEPALTLLEVGPGQTLATFARRHPAAGTDRVVLTSLRHPQEAAPDMAVLLATLGRLWLAGVPVDWAGFTADEERRRVPLPTYPFERQRYWVDARPATPQLAAPAELHKRANLADWLYAPSWQRADLLDQAPPASGAALLFADAPGLGDLVAQRLTRAGMTVVSVRAGAGFAQVGANAYTIAPDARADYDALIAELYARDCAPAAILHLWNADAAALDFDAAQAQGWTSLTWLAQAFGEYPNAQPLTLLAVAAGVQEVTGDEMLAPERATLLGVCRVIPQEYPHIVCRVVDLVAPAPDSPQAARLADRLAAELAAPAAPTVAYRGNHRWVQTFAPLALPDVAPRLRPGGVYLITGGLGRIGLALAGYLARTVQARLVLVGRTPAERNAAVQALEAQGAEVLVAAADVADSAQLRAVIARAEARFGAIHGVFHAAGVVGDAALRPIAAVTPEDYARQLQPKARGALALAEALRGRELDFCMLVSSLAAVAGGLGMAAYAAANAFLDLFAQQQRQAGAPWISVNWDGWQFADEQTRLAAIGAGLADLAITPDEGVAVFARLLTLPPVAQAIVSTADLATRMQRRPGRAAPAAEQPAATLHPRPQIGSAYVAPRTPLEQAIATLWQNVLGIAAIGIHDNFFELGGHSLLATQLVSRLRDAYQVELPLRNLFEEPTVAGLAALIEAARQAAGPALPAIAPAPPDGELPLSFGQQRLWFLDQLEPGSPLYNNPAAIRLNGDLDPAMLERSLNEIVRRHTVLRTTFANVEGRPVQICVPAEAMPPAFQLLDLRDQPDATREAEVTRLAYAEAQRPFDLTTGPLLRLTLLRLADADYVALLTMHHIVSDGWSVGVLLRELVTCYAAFAAGQPAPLADPPIQYAAYAAWQRQWLQGAALEQQIDYWRRQLGAAHPRGLPPALELPLDRPRPAVQTYAGATRWLTLPRDLTAALEALSRQEGVTLFMTLVAAFNVLLHRYTEQEDICIGTPVAGRSRAETEGLIGFFINTLVLRNDLAGNPTFRELLQRVRARALDAYARQDVPFETVVDALQPERDLSRTPFFQVMFVLQEAQLPVLELPGLTVTPMEIDTGTAKFDLTLYLEQGHGGLRGWFNFNTDLFDAATIARMQEHLLTLLTGIVADPAQPVAALPLLDDAERRQVVNLWNATATGDPPAPGVHRVIEAQAARAPNAPAVVCEGERLTYAELNRRANQLAHRLRRLDIGPERIVGVCLERSVTTVVALLGILKAGGAYLPLDPAYPAERLAFMIDDARPLVVLHDEASAGVTAPWAAQTVNLSDWNAISQEPATNLPDDPARTDLAYVIYTSGSTGRPKGVMIEHGAFADHCRDIVRFYALTPDDGVLQFASLNFDASLEQIIPTLMAGAKLVLRGPAVWDPAEFHQRVADEGLTVINPPTAYWHQLVQEWARAPEHAPAGQVRLVIAGGDAMRPELARLWRQTPMAATRLLNAYGPTETTITALVCEVNQLDAAALHRRIPIGRPLPNRCIYILDRHGRPAPIGVVGELFIGGQGVARGYLNRLELTAERFISDPFGSVEHSSAQRSTLYRTGDLARYRPDGSVEFVGRADNQVKIRGFRVEIGEIETALGQHPAVREAVVLVREDAAGEKRLAAYAVPAPGAVTDVNSAHLRDFLKMHLPDYMIPSAFVLLDALPLTPSGKVDRKALLTITPDHPTGADEAYVAPRDPVEAELARVWAEVLGVERVSIHANFFDLGGHSLLATQLVARLRETFAVDLPLRRLFETPTVAGLALILAESQAEQADDADLEQLLAELEQLSDAEAQALLSSGPDDKAGSRFS